MDIKMLMIGILIASLIFLTGTTIILNVGTTYTVDTAQMNATLSPIQSQQFAVQNDMNTTAEAMKSMFTNTSAQQQSTTGWSELDALYKAAGGVARLSINSLRYVAGMISVVFGTFPVLYTFMAFAIVSFIIALIISIAYLVFFRIPR